MGTPGTGKTTLLRSLARQWTPWCDTMYVTDPDRLFNDPAYLNTIMLDGDDHGANNEELWRLHPAVTRPGRCLAQIEVGRLSPAEAAIWLAEHDIAASISGHVGPDGATIAELYALRNGEPTTDVATARLVGQYL